MGIQFLGPSTPMGFTPQAYRNIVNGSKAIAPKQIFDNQAWLATQDVGAGTLYTSPTGVLAHTDTYLGVWDLDDPVGTLHTTGPIEQRIKVSPYAAYVDVWVWCVRDYAIGSPNNPTLFVKCVETGDTRSSTLISGGTDSTGKTASYPACDEAQWVRFEGVPVGAVGASDEAVQVRRDRSSDHKPVTLQVWASDASIRIYTVCYRVVPYKGSMASWDGEEPFAFYRILVGEQLTVPTFTPTDPEEWTISFWFRYRALPPEGTYSQLLTTTFDGTPISDWNLLQVKDTCELRLSASLEDVTTLSPGVWHHFAGVVQPEGNVYVDQVLYGGDAWGTVDPGGVFSFLFGGSEHPVDLDIANVCVFDGVHYYANDLYLGGPKFDPRNAIGSWSGSVPARQYITGRNGSGVVINSGDGGTANLTSSAGTVTSVAF